MKQPEGDTVYAMYIMQHFDCNKSMADLIIKSYKANGNYENIKRLCEQERNTQHGSK